MKTLIIGGLAAAILLAAPPAAQAASIKGSVAFAGDWQPMVDGALVSSIPGANGVHFIAPIVTTLPSTDDYASVPPGTVATYTDFRFSGSGGGPSGPPVAPLWTFTSGPKTYSFDLLSVSVVTQTFGNLQLSGKGILKITGLDDTQGRWTFDGDRFGEQEAIFRFTSDTAAGHAPEPASLMMMGAGLLGTIGAVRRRWSL